MDVFLQATAAVLLAVVLCLVLNRQDKELSVLLTIGVCCMVLLLALRYVQPVVDFFHQLKDMGQLNSDFLEILMKVVGIGFLSEIACLVCTDAGNASLGKTLQMMATFVILWLSIPLLGGLMDLIQNILGEI